MLYIIGMNNRPVAIRYQVFYKLTLFGLNFIIILKGRKDQREERTGKLEKG